MLCSNYQDKEKLSICKHRHLIPLQYAASKTPLKNPHLLGFSLLFNPCPP